jgi:hypothetical protein
VCTWSVAWYADCVPLLWFLVFSVRSHVFVGIADIINDEGIHAYQLFRIEGDLGINIGQLLTYVLLVVTNIYGCRLYVCYSYLPNCHNQRL